MNFSITDDFKLLARIIYQKDCDEYEIWVKSWVSITSFSSRQIK